MKSGKRVQSKNFILFIQKNKLGFHRLGMVLKKEVGPATYRNRVKRYFREFFRLNKHQMGGSFDLVILAKKGNVLKRYREAEEELKGLFVRWRRERFVGCWERSYSFWSIFINTPFQPFLGPAVVLPLPALRMLLYPFDASESRKEPGLPWGDSLSAIPSILEDMTRSLIILKTLRKESKTITKWKKRLSLR